MVKKKPTATIDAELVDKAAEEMMAPGDFKMIPIGDPPDTLTRLPSTDLTPAQMLSTGVSMNYPPELIEKLMDLQERWEANEAKKAFVAAMAAFKKETIVITKNKHVSYKLKTGGVTEYNHASLDHILGVAIPFLSKHGFSHKWLIAEENQVITVTCVVTHKKGHSESTSFSGNPDTSGTKNPLQAKASTVTYLERYTFLAITGLAAKDQDDDGKGANLPEEGGELLSVDQVNAITAMLDENNLDQAAFLKFIKKDTIVSIKASAFEWCIEQIEFVIKRHKANVKKVSK